MIMMMPGPPTGFRGPWERPKDEAPCERSEKLKMHFSAPPEIWPHVYYFMNRAKTTVIC